MVKFFFVGDCVPTLSVKIGPNLRQVLESHDICCFNLEGSFSVEEIPLFKAGPHLLLNESALSSISTHFNVATLANNHAMDFGEEGLLKSLSICSQRGLKTIGAGLNIDEAFKPLDMYGVRLIAVAEHEFGGASRSTPGIASTDYFRKLYNLVVSGKKEGLKIIVVAHGGTEVIPIPPPYLRERYKLWVDYGVDVVIGSHPHSVQGFECYKQGTIFYSLGNFHFPGYPTHKHPNTDWSLGASIDMEQNSITIYPISAAREGILEIETGKMFYQSQLHELCSLLKSKEYLEIYHQISSQLYTKWYRRLAISSKYDAALLLHYLRCDAHRHIVSNALSQILGEGKSSTSDFQPDVQVKHINTQFF
jgi:poly-gamma-glutamate synthesis protein (capsule biosynthesis protein)